MAKEKTYSELTTPFCIEENFFDSVEDYAIHADIDEETVNDLPDDYSVDVDLAQEEKIFLANEHIIDDCMESIITRFEDRFPSEQDEQIENKVKKAFIDSIDWEKFNSLLPVMWYPNGKIAKVTKQDLVNACK